MVSYYTFLRIFEIFLSIFLQLDKKKFAEIFFADVLDNLKKNFRKIFFKSSETSAKIFLSKFFSAVGKYLKTF
jgi:hypothetical protein